MSNPPPRHRNQYGSSPTTQIKQNSRPDILPGSNRKFVNDGPGSKTRSIKEANMEIDISNVAGSDAGNDQQTFKTEAGVSSISTKMKTSRSNVERTKDRGLQGDNKKNEIRQEVVSLASNRSKREDPADYYKYWKQKANEYQSENFVLNQENSTLRQEIQILKHQNYQLNKKLQLLDAKNDSQTSITSLQVQPKKNPPHSSMGRKLEESYQLKINEHKKIIEEQRAVIRKLQAKIKDLSTTVEQNNHLKHILKLMEAKIQERNSLKGSRASSNGRSQISRNHNVQIMEQSNIVYGYEVQIVQVTTEEEVYQDSP